jgi:CRP/FNR family transcriptional regulator, nitrogen oxide reductase regulator
MANEEELDSILHADLLTGLDASDVARIVGAAGRQVLPDGGQLMKQGDAPDYLYLVERGRIRMTVVTPDGSQLTLRMMGSGDVIGCVAVFRSIPYPATATAVAPTAVLSWTSAQINDLIRTHPQLASNALAIVGGRADELLQRLRETTTERVEQRIARALMRMTPRQHHDETDRVVIPASRAELAEFTGATLYTVSRTISAWARQGIVLGGRRRITVVDRRRLSAIAGTDR